jgi:ubiquinol-cytochrome c reductase cytochrome b subunit
VLHGRETGTIYRTETGEFFEVHAPLDDAARWTLVQHHNYAPLALAPTQDEHGVRRPGTRLDGLRRRVSSFYFEDRIEPVTPAELEAAHHAQHGHDQHELGRDEHEVIDSHEGSQSTPIAGQ